MTEMEWCERPGVGEDELSLLEDLADLLRDEEGRILLRRQLSLAYQILAVAGNNMSVSALGPMSVCLEYFAEESIREPYGELFLAFCELCTRPVLMDRTSDLLLDRSPLPHFFTSLGRCLRRLEGRGHCQLVVLEVVSQLLTGGGEGKKKKKQEEQKNAAKLRVTSAREAVDRSGLVPDLLHLCREASGWIYTTLLTLFMLLIKHCQQGGKLLSLGSLDLILGKLSVERQLSAVQREAKELTSQLLWEFLSEEYSPHTQPSHSSLVKIREWFRRDMLHGVDAEATNIAALILKIVHLHPQLKLHKALILQDAFLMATRREFGGEDTWAAELKPRSSRVEMKLKKLFITIISLKLEDVVTQVLARDFGYLRMLVLLLADREGRRGGGGRVHWSPEQRKELASYSLQAVSLALAWPFIRQDYPRSGATQGILKLLERSAGEEKNYQLTKLCSECLLSIMSTGDLNPHFIELPVGNTILNLLSRILNEGNITLILQEILEDACYILSHLGSSSDTFKQKEAERLERLAVQLMKRLHSPGKYDSISEDSLLIAAGAFVWNCVILNPLTRKNFIMQEGLYTILDIIETVAFPVQSYYLGLLCDSCWDAGCISQLVTWRGRRVNTTLLALLARLWTKQETLKQVARDSAGSITDLECSLMGEKQKLTEINSFTDMPALIEMFGCARPKIASIVNLLTKSYRYFAELSKSVYMVPYDNLSSRDQITLEVIKRYEELKEGEMFWEIQKALEATKTKVLPLDLTICHSLVTRQVGTAKYILRKQRGIQNKAERIALEKEKALYYDIQESEMVKTLQKAQEVKTYLQLSNLNYRKELISERHELLSKLKHKTAPDSENYHNTFMTYFDPRLF